MKKVLLFLIVFPILLASCSDDTKDDLTPSLKKVNVEIQRTSDQLALLEDNNMFTVSLDTKFVKSDWSLSDENDGKRLLIKVNKELTAKSTFEFEQSKVNFQLVNVSYIMDENTDEEDISYTIKIIVRVDNKIIKEETISPFQEGVGHIFQFIE